MHFVRKIWTKFWLSWCNIDFAPSCFLQSQFLPCLRFEEGSREAQNRDRLCPCTNFRDSSLRDDQMSFQASVTWLRWWTIWASRPRCTPPRCPPPPTTSATRRRSGSGGTRSWSRSSSGCRAWWEKNRVNWSNINEHIFIHLIMMWGDVTWASFCKWPNINKIFLGYHHVLHGWDEQRRPPTRGRLLRRARALPGEPPPLHPFYAGAGKQGGSVSRDTAVT